MRRGLLGLAALLMVIATACHSSDPIRTGDGIQVHWVQTTAGNLERQIDVIVPAKYLTSVNFRDAVRNAVAQGDRSPYVNFTLRAPTTAPTSCPVTHCIIVERRPMNGGLASIGWDSKGHVYGNGVDVWIDSAATDRGFLFNALCHEVAGHGLALAHSSHGTQGPCVNGALTSHDLTLINQGHNHKDPKLYPGALGTASAAELERQHGKLRFHTHGHDRAFYERLSKSPGLPEQVGQAVGQL